MAVYFSDLDDFGKGVDIDAIMQKYRMYFGEDFSTDQIIAAIHAHCAMSPVIPKVSHLTAILRPPPPKITQAEYIAAKEWQKRNSKFDQFTDAADTIKAFEGQEQQGREQHKITCEKMQKTLSNTIKRIA